MFSLVALTQSVVVDGLQDGPLTKCVIVGIEIELSVFDIQIPKKSHSSARVLPPSKRSNVRVVCSVTLLPMTGGGGESWGVV